MEEMEKRSDRHIRDLVAHTAFKGLDANEIGCARISVMAGGQLLPSKGRIQMSKTNYLQAVISDLQRTAGPYRCATKRLVQCSQWCLRSPAPPRLFCLHLHRSAEVPDCAWRDDEIAARRFVLTAHQ